LILEEFMRVDLRELQPNPLRDFTIDPIDPERVETLKQSIEEDGFWSGIVCRRLPDGTIQIVAGHHRVHAALAAGVTSADVFVAEEMDDTAMLRIYARENATQRGNTGTGHAGSVACALRVLAKAVMTGSLGRILPRSQKAEETIRGNLTAASGEGIGWRLILDCLGRIPGYSEYSVKEELANLKASGDYARILQTVQDEIVREHMSVRAAMRQGKPDVAVSAQYEKTRQAMDMGQAAVDLAAQQEQTFDRVGVAQHLPDSHHQSVFRELVTSIGYKSYFPLNEQAAVASRLAEEARQRGQRITEKDIRDYLTAEAWKRRQPAQAQSREEEEHRMRESYVLRARRYQEDVARHLTAIAAITTQLRELESSWPRELEFPMSGEFEHALEALLRSLVQWKEGRRAENPAPHDLSKLSGKMEGR
jgi:ParB/RepB/Spo0J family partition protein